MSHTGTSLKEAKEILKKAEADIWAIVAKTEAVIGSEIKEIVLLQIDYSAISNPHSIVRTNAIKIEIGL